MITELRSRAGRAWAAWRQAPQPPGGRSDVDGGRSPQFVASTVNDLDRDTNLAWNRERWGQRGGWESHDHFGYQWGGGVEQTVGGLAAFADEHLGPFTEGRHDLDILELSPGGGRFTAELIRYAASMTLVDMTSDCIEVCRERFRYFPTRIDYFVNDGTSLAAVSGRQFDTIACYDSMVHMHPSVIEGYVEQMSSLVRSTGFIWLDHSGKGERKSGHRTAMTAEAMAGIAARCGLTVTSQKFRNSWDCITVLRPSTSATPSAPSPPHSG